MYAATASAPVPTATRCPASWALDRAEALSRSGAEFDWKIGHPATSAATTSRGPGLDQNPRTGKLKEGGTVTLVVSDGPDAARAARPQPADAGDGRRPAAEHGPRVVNAATEQYDENVRPATSWPGRWESPNPAASRSRRAPSIDRLVSQGPAPRTVPDSWHAFDAGQRGPHRPPSSRPQQEHVVQRHGRRRPGRVDRTRRPARRCDAGATVDRHRVEGPRAWSPCPTCTGQTVDAGQRHARSARASPLGRCYGPADKPVLVTDPPAGHDGQAGHASTSTSVSTLATASSGPQHVGERAWEHSTAGSPSSPAPVAASAASTRCCSRPEGAKVVVNDLGGAMRRRRAATARPAEQVVDEIKAMGGEAVANGDNVADWEGGQRLVNAADRGVRRPRRPREQRRHPARPRARQHDRGGVGRGHRTSTSRATSCPTRWAAAYWREQTKAGKEVKPRRSSTRRRRRACSRNPGQANYGAAKSGIATFSPDLRQGARPLRRASTASRPPPAPGSPRRRPGLGDIVKAPDEPAVRRVGPGQRLAARRLPRHRRLPVHRRDVLRAGRHGAARAVVDDGRGVEQRRPLDRRRSSPSDLSKLAASE